MSKYVANTEELQKAIALLTHIDGKLNDLSKRITAAYYQLDGQKSVVDFFDKAVNKGKIPKNHEITVEEMKGIVRSYFPNCRENAYIVRGSDRIKNILDTVFEYE